ALSNFQLQESVGHKDMRLVGQRSLEVRFHGVHRRRKVVDRMGAGAACASQTGRAVEASGRHLRSHIYREFSEAGKGALRTAGRELLRPPAAGGARFACGPGVSRSPARRALWKLHMAVEYFGESDC